MYVNIAVLKETAPGEHRVALVPGVVPGLIKLGGRLHMESGAAEGIGLADSDFADVVVIADRAVLVADADVVLCVQPPALAVTLGHLPCRSQAGCTSWTRRRSRSKLQHS